jgi:hypothetical protein
MTNKNIGWIAMLHKCNSNIEEHFLFPKSHDFFQSFPFKETMTRSNLVLLGKCTPYHNLFYMNIILNSYYSNKVKIKTFIHVEERYDT